jgi:peptidyl-prolyl cis-trans isomerase C
MNKFCITLLSLALLITCFPALSSECLVARKDSASLAKSDKLLATVNNRPVTQSFFERYLAERTLEQPDSNDAKNHQIILNELINIELIVQDAIRSGHINDDNLQSTLAFFSNKLITRSMLKNTIGKNAPSEQRLKSAYQAYAKNLTNEYQVSHIPVASQKQSLSIIRALQRGESFSALAKKYSIGPTGKNGGSLGWVNAAMLPKPLANTISRMQKGSFTTQPIQSKVGWHVILLTDKRTATPSSFDQVKPQLNKILKERALENYLNKLRTQANIKKY